MRKEIKTKETENQNEKIEKDWLKIKTEWVDKREGKKNGRRRKSKRKKEKGMNKNKNKMRRKERNWTNKLSKRKKESNMTTWSWMEIEKKRERQINDRKKRFSKIARVT